MVVRVVNSKSDRGRNSHTNIAKDRQCLIQQDVRMTSPMREVVNQNMTCVSDRTSKNVNHEGKNPPGGILYQSTSYFHQICEKEVERHQNESQNETVRFGGNQQLGDFGVLFQNKFSSGEMGLRSEDIAEVGFRGFLVLVEILGAGRGLFTVDEVVRGFLNAGRVCDGHVLG